MGRLSHPKDTSWVWHVFQWKYGVDASSGWLTRTFFRCVFLPFNRWAYKHFDLAPPVARELDGRPCWLDHQGSYADAWQAEQDAAKYPFGHVVKVPFQESLAAETVDTQQIFPNSPPRVQKMYARNGHSNGHEKNLGLARLAEALAKSEPVVQRFKST